MIRTKRKWTITDLWKWLESRLHEINLKLDHILFRLREEDPRIYQNEPEYAEEEISEQTEEVKDI